MSSPPSLEQSDRACFEQEVAPLEKHSLATMKEKNKLLVTFGDGKKDVSWKSDSVEWLFNTVFFCCRLRGTR